MRKKANDTTARNLRARRLHQMLREPGRRGLSAKGADQLRNYFSNKVPKSEQRSLDEMDPVASMTLLLLAAEEVDARDESHGMRKQATGETTMANEEGDGGEAWRAGEETMQARQTGEVEEEVMEAEEDAELGGEGDEQGGVALAKDW